MALIEPLAAVTVTVYPPAGVPVEPLVVVVLVVRPPPPQPVMPATPAISTTSPNAVHIRRRGTTNTSRQPSAIPPIRSPSSCLSLGASAAEEPVVFTVNVAFTTEFPVTEAVEGTTHVGAAVEDVPPETAQLS